MKKEYMAPEFEDLDLKCPALMDTVQQNTENGPFVDESHVVDEPDPFA